MVGALALGLLASASWGAAFSASPTGVAGQVGGGVAEGAGCGSTFLTQSTSQSIAALNSISCNTGGLHTDNSYFRAYDMSGYPDGFDVCEVAGRYRVRDRRSARSRRWRHPADDGQRLLQHRRSLSRRGR